MKKILIALFFLSFSAVLFSWVCDGCPAAYKYNYDGSDAFGSRSYLPDMASDLEDNHGIRVFIKIDHDAEKYDTESTAKDYFNSLDFTPQDRAVVIFTSEKNHESSIMLSDSLKTVFNGNYVKNLQDDVLDSLQGKWYIDYRHVLAKVLGSFVYMLEKQNMTAAQIDDARPHMIIADDALYNISLLPVIRDIIALFYMEPLSFIFYFPFVMYFLMVRWAGCGGGRMRFVFSNIIWGALMIFFAALIINRVNIYLNEYVSALMIICGFNVPVYALLYWFYRDSIGSAAYSYLNDVTGGFDKLNIFEGNRWEK
jgi:hypothetical protein